MNEINCDNCRLWLHGYLDNELDTTMATRVALHLETCLACKRAHEEMKALKAGVKKHAAYYEAPVGLSQNIFSAIHAQASSAVPIGQKLRDWFAPAFSTAALAMAVLLFVATPQSRNPWADEAVSSHVRSLMAEHLNDVASSDRHTVKPWFAGRLDFSPPVYDFTAQDYPLLGGRVDYLQHQTVAALTYRHNKHIINVFVLPVIGADSPAQNLSDRGYNIIFWHQNHMRFIVVSDLNKNELASFSELMQKGM